MKQEQICEGGAVDGNVGLNDLAVHTILAWVGERHLVLPFFPLKSFQRATEGLAAGC